LRKADASAIAASSGQVIITAAAARYASGRCNAARTQGPPMVTSSAFAFLHFLAVFGIFATIFLQWQTMSASPTLAEARRIQTSDRWYGILAGVVLIVGFLRVYHFEKGKDFYIGNPFFYAKLTLFALVGLLSIYPTVRYLKWRAQTRQGLAPVVSAEEYKRIALVLRIELVLLLATAVCASLMARGVGLSRG
jgi:putative membrane protein